PEIGALTNLTYLYLNSNHLTELPPEIGALTNLTYLYLNSNHLTELPPEIGALTNLGYLGLNDNQLTELPPEIGALTNLTNLGLNSNQVPEELLAAAAAGIDVLARYLDELSVEGQGVPLWEAKVLLVGEGEVGKSSLLGALRGDPWDPDRDSTHGLEITPLRLTHPEQHDVTLELNAWDFGGQDVYRPTHQLFFTAPAVYLVVWKPRLGQSQSQVDDWLRMITLRAPTGSRCLIVATHGGPGDHLANIAKDALTERYGDLITGFFEVDCEPNADGESDPRIADVRASIANAAASLPEMGHPYPEAWTKFRCRITPGHPDADQAVSSAPYVRYSELEQLADGAGIDSGAARALCAIASRRGQWIHYGDPENPPMPDDLVVTQPEWLAKAISFVMNDGVTRDAAGLLREDDLGRIWANPSNNAQYEPELYPVFVSLMESYDLAYEIEQSLDERAAGLPNRWLVAQLVPESPNPDRLRTATEGSDRARSVEWIVGFSDLDGEDVPVPYGLLYRLIVRFHGYSLGASDNAKAVHWQLGVVLRHDTYGVATVQVDDHIGGIRIKAMGTRPELLAGEVAADIQRSIVPQFWRGMTSSLAAACGSGCPNDTPGKGVFEIEHLLKAQDDNELTIRCHARRCGERVQIESLLSGYKPPAGIGDSGVILGALADLGHKVDSVSRRSDEHANAVLRAVERVPRGVASELAPYFSEHLAELRGGLNVLDGRMAELAAQANEHLDLFLADTDDPAQHGPRLITARAHDPHLLKRGWLTTEITFTLWCEYSRQPLYFIHGDPDNGRYRVPVTRATIKRVLPLLSLATKVVAGFSPVALMAGETHLEKATFEAIQSDVATAVSSLDVLSDAASLAADLSDSESESGGSLVNVDGGPLSGPTLRAVQDLIRNEDPNFAGLEMRRDKQRRRLWVDPSNFHRFPEGGAYG
ncbi:MAG: COR domain-containing protein, partial [Actinomycetota bacterium]